MRLDLPAPMLPATAMNAVPRGLPFVMSATSVEGAVRQFKPAGRPEGLPIAAEIVYKRRSLNEGDRTMKASPKNRAKTSRRKAARLKKHRKARLRASSGQQKF